jgi:hypothetical protein
MGTSSNTPTKDARVLVPPHSAAASWSGYIYQGHIALSHCLKLLLEDSARYQSYFLQLESADDFAIFDELRKTPISLHQVKSVKGTTITTHREALDKLNQKRNDYQEATLYFHVANQIQKADKNLESDINDDIQASHPYVTLYSYENNEHHLPITEDLTYLKKQIESYLEHYNNARISDADAYLGKMLIQISSCILNIHSKSQNVTEGLNRTAADPLHMIPLKEFHDVLVSSLIGENRLHALTHNIIHTAFTEAPYVERFKDHQEKIGEYHKAFLKLSPEQVKQFAQSLLPHKKQDYNNTNIPNWHECTFKKEDLRDSLIKALAYIEPKASHHEKGQLLWTQNTDSYCATSIKAYENDDHNVGVTEVSQGILENALLNLEHLYETSFFVTPTLNTPNIMEASNVITAPDSENDKEASRFAKFKVLGLISRDEAKKRLKNAGGTP